MKKNTQWAHLPKQWFDWCRAARLRPHRLNYSKRRDRFATWTWLRGHNEDWVVRYGEIQMGQAEPVRLPDNKREFVALVKRLVYSVSADNPLFDKVTGPISTLPGTAHHMPKGATCDVHPGVPAVKRIQGETDSFGSELNDMCQQCVDAWHAYRESAEATTGQCDWCKSEVTTLASYRDSDEGMYGPIYDVCKSCRDKARERDIEYLESSGDYDYDYDYD